MSSRRAGFIFLEPLVLWIALLSLGESAEARDWTVFHDCVYLPNPANDGDSFHVRARNKEYIFRLYFVDAPETDSTVRKRVREQSTYFHATVSQTLELGREAAVFTQQKLVRPFTVRTCFQDARGRSHLPRYFAFIEIGGADLGESLIANGLARVYGAASEAPGINSPEVEWRKLEELEAKAKQEKIGGWGIAVGRIHSRAATEPGVSSDYFLAFFHPKTVNAAQPERAGGKVDVNSATTEQLESIPGIGPVLAQRIIAARPFQSADDLQRVKGIKAKKYETLRPYFQ